MSSHCSNAQNRIVFGNECAVVLGEEVDEVSRARDVDGEVPFIVGAGVAVEDEESAHEQTTQVCATRRVQVVSICHSVRGDAPRTNQSLRTVSSSLFFPPHASEPVHTRTADRFGVLWSQASSEAAWCRYPWLHGETLPCTGRWRLSCLYFALH